METYVCAIYMYVYVYTYIYILYMYIYIYIHVGMYGLWAEVHGFAKAYTPSRRLLGLLGDTL